MYYKGTITSFVSCLFCLLSTALADKVEDIDPFLVEPDRRSVWERHWTFFLVVIILLAVSLFLGIFLCICLKICRSRNASRNAKTTVRTQQTPLSASNAQPVVTSISEDKGFIIPLDQVVTSE